MRLNLKMGEDVSEISNFLLISSTVGFIFEDNENNFVNFQMGNGEIIESGLTKAGLEIIQKYALGL